jgi:general secretion pathway protein C
MSSPEVQVVKIAGTSFELRPRPPGAQSVRAELPPLSPHIRSRGENRFDVDRVIVREYAYNLNKLMKLAYVSPHKDDLGRIDGYRVGGIRRGNILYQGGLRSGDVMMSVNGRAIRSMTQVLLAHSTLRFRDDFEVVVLRRGRPVVLNYNLVR